MSLTEFCSFICSFTSAIHLPISSSIKACEINVKQKGSQLSLAKSHLNSEKCSVKRENTGSNWQVLPSFSLRHSAVLPTGFSGKQLLSPAQTKTTLSLKALEKMLR